MLTQTGGGFIDATNCRFAIDHEESEGADAFFCKSTGFAREKAAAKQRLPGTFI